AQRQLRGRVQRPHRGRDLPGRHRRGRRMTDLVAIIASGIVYGSIYGLVAIGTMLILDMAQGSMVMIGSYVGWWALAVHGVNPVLALLLAFVVAFHFAAATE